MDEALAGPEMVARLRGIDIAYTASRLAVIKRQSRIGPGIQILRHGCLAAFCAPDIPSDYFNRVVGVRVDALERLDRVHMLFRSRGARCTVLRSNSPRAGSATAVSKPRSIAASPRRSTNGARTRVSTCSACRMRRCSIRS